MAAKHPDKLKTAIMCPPDIYGPGRGPGKTQSVYFPVLWTEIQKIGAPFYADEGTNTRSWVHIEDLMTMYLKLVEAAVAGGQGADWGKEVFTSYSFSSIQSPAH
jgi:nucleoside-diphosphate-sugar epimerase